jgi:hypothetical protein
VGLDSGELREHVVPAGRRGRNLLENIPVLDDFAILVEAEYVNGGRIERFVVRMDYDKVALGYDTVDFNVHSTELLEKTLYSL